MQESNLGDRFFSTYIPKSGLILSSPANSDYACDIIYRLEDGILQEVGRGEFNYYFTDDSDDELYYTNHTWNGQEVATHEEYEQLLSQNYDFNQSIDIGEVTEMTMSELLNLLQDDRDFPSLVEITFEEGY